MLMGFGRAVGRWVSGGIVLGSGLVGRLEVARNPSLYLIEARGKGSALSSPTVYQK
jgi:hypothetical protein